MIGLRWLCTTLEHTSFANNFLPSTEETLSPCQIRLLMGPVSKCLWEESLMLIPNYLSFRWLAKLWHKLVMMENSCHLEPNCCIRNIKWLSSLAQLCLSHCHCHFCWTFHQRRNHRGNWTCYLLYIENFWNCRKKQLARLAWQGCCWGSACKWRHLCEVLQSTECIPSMILSSWDITLRLAFAHHVQIRKISNSQSWQHCFPH